MTIGQAVGSSITGTFTQGVSSTVNTTSDLTLGQNGTGNYNLDAGTLNTTGSAILVGSNSSSTGTFTEDGGNLNQDATSSIIIGGATADTSGTYNLSAGTANFGGTFTLNSTGKFNQTGGAANFTNDFVYSTGTFSQTAGSDNFGGGLEIGTGQNFSQRGGFDTVTGGTLVDAGAIYTQAGGSLTTDTMDVEGTVNQSGGTIVIQGTSNLTINGTYNLGGTLVSSGFTHGGGTLNLAGGTLMAGTGGALFDFFNSTISATSALDTTHNDIIIDGILSGPGGLIVQGPGTVYFDQANTYAGGTTIQGGATLYTSLSFLPTTGSITFNNGTLNLLQDGTSEFITQTLQGTNGSLTGQGAPSTLELVGSATLGGTTLLTAGSTLQVFNGNLSDIEETGASVAVQIGGASLVAGAPTVPTSGTVTIGTANYTGMTTVSPNFTLMMNGLNGALANSGTIIPTGALPGVGTNNITINGDFSQSATGTFAVRVNPFSNDEYDPTSASNLSGRVEVIAQGSTTQVILDAGAGTVTPNGLTVFATSPLIVPTLIYTPNTISVQTVQGTTLPYAQTSNQRNVSQAIDPSVVNPNFAFVPVVAALDSLTAEQIPGALQQLSANSLQYMGDIARENTTFMVQNVDGQLANLRSGYSGLDTSGLSVVAPGLGSSLGRSLLAYYAPAPNGVNYYHENPDDVNQTAPLSNDNGRTISDSPDPLSSPTTVPAPRASRLTEFLSGDVILADLKQDGSQNNATNKATYTAGNVTGGVGFRMTNNLAAGVLFDYTHTDAKTDSQGSKTKVDSYSPGLFATFFKNGFYANGIFSYGYNQYSNTRDINFGGLSSQAKSSPDGNQYVTNADFGYDFQPEKHIIIGPTLGFQYTHLDIDTFTETGAGPLNLAVNDESLDSLRGRLGAHLIYQVHVASVLLQPHISASWQHEFLDTSYGITSQFALPGNPSSNFQTNDIGRDSALLSFGLNATLDNSLSAYLNYLAEIGQDDYFVQSVQGGFKAEF